MRFGIWVEETGSQPTSIDAKIPVEKEIYILMDALKQGDPRVKVYLVGGAVRDFLAHQYHGDPSKTFQPDDYDLTCNLPGDEITRRFKTSYAKQLGVKFQNKQSQDTFGVVFAHLNGKDYEVAPFRIDIGSVDGRRPEDTQVGTIYDDAMRRDLTINNLYYDLELHKILDFNPNGQGLKDVESKQVNMVGDPRERFAEDRLRILRVPRFFARLSTGSILQGVSRDTLQAVGEYGQLRVRMGHLLPITAERIQGEFVKGMKQALDKAVYLQALVDLGLMEAVFPNASLNPGDINHLHGIASTKVAMAWLLRGNGDVSSYLLRLKYPGEVANSVGFLIRCLSFEPENVFELIKKRKNFPGIKQDMMELSRIANNPRLAHLASYQPVYPGGQELMQQGFEGPDIGAQQSLRATDHYTKNYQEPPLTPEP